MPVKCQSPISGRDVVARWKKAMRDPDAYVVVIASSDGEAKGS